MRASAATGPQPAIAPDAAAIRVAVVAGPGEAGSGAEPAAYEIFTIETVDVGGARLVAPLLLEVGEEVTLRLVHGDVRAEVRARVTAIERGEPGARDAVAVVEFVDAGAAEQVRAVIGA